MDDQNQTKPQLTLEEELDVLEAVYKIGKEKGLELLRPDQLKKLRDGGRMGKKRENRNFSEVAENVTKQLFVRMIKKYATNTNVLEQREVFKRMYGAYPIDFLSNLQNRLMLTENYV